MYTMYIHVYIWEGVMNDQTGENVLFPLKLRLAQDDVKYYDSTTV
jgi:hypothetical protein